MNRPAIVFMGTPEFAVASLDAIIKAGYPVRGVITSPDKPSGRGLQLHASPVKEYALKKGLPVLQPLKLKDPAFLAELKLLKADLQVVVAFRMLPEEVWNMPPFGTFNLHASLLPQYRGAAPINWAIINGEQKTGVTTFFLNHEIDKGSIIFSEETFIGESENAGNVHDRLMEIGSKLVVKTIDAIANRTIVAVEQPMVANGESLKPAPKIHKEDCRIRWNEPVQKIHNFIRGLSPYPAAWSEIKNDIGELLLVKIFEAKPRLAVHNLPAGHIVSENKQIISIAAANGFIDIVRIQLQGKKQLATADFLRGFPQISEYRFV